MTMKLRKKKKKNRCVKDNNKGNKRKGTNISKGRKREKEGRNKLKGKTE